MTEKSRVLLTGYSGFLGRYLGKSLIQCGFLLKVLLHKHTILRKELEKNVDVVWGSIDDIKTINKAINNIDYVVHSAWDSNSHFNEQATFKLFSESIRKGVKKFVFISSVAVYGMNDKNKLLIDESNPIPEPKDLKYLYPSEKANAEKSLRKLQGKKTALAIFRPGPIFDDYNAPINKLIKFGYWNFGLGIGNGKNQMAFIHSVDVADAVIRWLIKGTNYSVFNVVPSVCMPYKKWLSVWAQKNSIKIKAVFIPGSIFFLMGFSMKILKKILGKPIKTDIGYAIACAKRNMSYSNEALKKSLNWLDKSTLEYVKKANTKVYK
ncbi:MAG: NAD-dependent epimerase/dehydratase family protein [Candidatus Helarchaeota archaeon]